MQPHSPERSLLRTISGSSRPISGTSRRKNAHQDEHPSTNLGVSCSSHKLEKVALTFKII
ncbi:hypothetical protein [Akkermansia sp.]|uniref:hypothetical protein n=1 Tax=Akkermansia sp. TaxID=1872421 RepID=UPI0025BB1693|nr:hypothetical protein [Akkermansia sp.]MCC8147858.1 hypothetical protein [Akkermansia sp.]